MSTGASRSRDRSRLYELAAALTVAIVAAVVAVSIADTRLATSLSIENGPMEWLQVVLLAGAGLMGARHVAREWAERRSGASDVVLTAGFAWLAICEMELPYYILGKGVKLSRLARDVAAGVPRDSLLVLAVAGLAAALGAYALRYRADLVAWGRSALQTAWGRLLLLGACVFLLVEIFERPLNRMMVGRGLPGPLLEETLELLAALYCFLAMTPRRDPGAADGRARPQRA